MGVIKEGLGAPGSTATVKLLPKRGTHGDRSIGLVKLHTVGRQFIDMGSRNINATIATNVVAVDVVPQQKNKVGLR